MEATAIFLVGLAVGFGVGTCFTAFCLYMAMAVKPPRLVQRDLDKMSEVVQSMRDADWNRRGYHFERRVDK